MPKSDFKWNIRIDKINTLSIDLMYICIIIYRCNDESFNSLHSII